MRDLVRARADAAAVSIQAKYRLKAFLIRQGRRYAGRDGWTLAYRRWLTDVRLPSPPQHIVLHDIATPRGTTIVVLVSRNGPYVVLRDA
jgi:transposase